MYVLPIGDKILVEVMHTEEISKGGIILAEVSKEEKGEGIVRAVGYGRVTDSGTVTPIRIEVGEKVLFGKYAGDNIEVEGKSYKILKEVEILAIVRG